MIKEGIINILKPMGMTSHDCIYVMRRLTGIKRIGHTGTLDPNATGVLPICIGSAARVTEYMDMDYKTYICKMILGIVTDTQDIWGEVIEDKRTEVLSNPFSEEEIRAAFSVFSGVIEQYPPKYSAVRVAGRRLYEYARDGAEVEIKPRTVYIENLEVLEVALDRQEITFRVTCSKGTYIRAICHEAGQILGCGGTLTALERIESGSFSIDNAVELEYLRALSNIAGPIRKCLEEAKKANDNVNYLDNNQVNFSTALAKLKTFFPKAELIYAAVSEQKHFSEIIKLIEDEVNKYIVPVDEGMTAFGRADIKTCERSKWFVNGGHIALNEVEILKRPKYETEDFPLKIREEYRRAYRLYAPQESIEASQDGKKNAVKEGQFLGVAFYNDKYKKLVADKVFTRY